MNRIAGNVAEQQGRIVSYPERPFGEAEAAAESTFLRQQKRRDATIIFDSHNSISIAALSLLQLNLLDAVSRMSQPSRAN
jgi:hypothetical protein